MDTCPITPLHRNVVVQRIGAETKTPGGIILPDTAQEKPMLARLVAAGGVAFTLTKEEMGIASMPAGQCVGRLVLIGKYAGTEVRVGGQDYIVLQDKDVLGIIDEDKA